MPVGKSRRTEQGRGALGDALLTHESGALYEVAFAMVLAAFALLVRKSLPRPGQLLWLVLGLYSLGRFLIFFAVRDVSVAALGLRQAQRTSLALIAVSLAGGLWSLRRPAAPGSRRTAGA